MPATKTHPACTVHEDGIRLSEWLDLKKVTYPKISPKMVNHRDMVGNAAAEEEEFSTSSVSYLKLL